MIAAMRGSSEGRQDMTRAVGRGSNWHVDGFDLQMRSKIAEGSGRRKEETGEKGRCSEEGGGVREWGSSAGGFCRFSD